jgi:hypothetical protein
MLRRFILAALTAMVSTAALTVSADETQGNASRDNVGAQRDDEKANVSKADGGAKALSGMSILGNQEAPKALVIVPWKSSQLGDSLGVDKSMDDSRGPIDKDVFMRELAYYEIRSNSK